MKGKKGVEEPGVHGLGDPRGKSCRIHATQTWMPPPKTVAIMAFKQLTPIRVWWLRWCLGFAYLNGLTDADP